MFLLRSERPVPHYSIALICRNTKIRLNGAISSFAFRGHFSCLKNSSNSNGAGGFIVIIASSEKLQRLGLHSQNSAEIVSALHSQLSENESIAQTKQGGRVINKENN